ncbi:V-type ATP synthase subunit I [Haloferacaceae archaeon DSL9]
MLRPEQMSKVSVTGSKRVLDDVVETVYGLRLLHLNDYDDTWEGFEPGTSMEGADEVSEKLVTVRSLESILDVDEKDAGPTRIIEDDELDAQLAEVRTTINELDDRRTDLQAQLREIDEELQEVRPFADLGIDLDLLSGYDTIDVAVGRGKREEIDAQLAAADDIGAYEIFGDGRTIAIFARPVDADAESPLADALVGAEFATLKIPDAAESPEEYVSRLRHRKQQLEAQLNTVKNELEEIKLREADFLLAAEEKLTIEAQKREAPLSFATTRNAFVAEGWIPTERVDELTRAIDAAVGEHAEVDELEVASFGADGSHAHTEHVSSGGSAAAADGGEARTDGGVTKSEPPVIQKNPEVASPFELLVEAVNRPKYREFDPTVLVFLTFPLMFGFMIGDIGYGLVYTGIGYYLYSQFDSPGFKSMGGVAMWAGLFTIIFGFFYDEFFGVHPFPQAMPEYLGLPVLSKGIGPAYIDWALAWLVISVLFGILHLNIGYVLSFIENREFHGLEEAVYESGSWLLMLNGVWIWIFSTHKSGVKPDFVFETFAAGGPMPFGFTGFPEIVGITGAVMAAVGLLLLLKGAPAEAVEALSVLANVLSYTRIAAVLLAKAGMALAVNLLAFGAYMDHGSFHFIFTPGYLAELQASGAEIVFPGLTTAGSIGIIGGLLVLVIGHLLVMILGITSAGLQGIRLEYVEFFGKFYEGGGDEYEPLGYERRYTTED